MPDFLVCIREQKSDRAKIFALDKVKLIDDKNENKRVSIYLVVK